MGYGYASTYLQEEIVSGADLSAAIGQGVRLNGSGQWVQAEADNAEGILEDGGAASGDVCSVIIQGHAKASLGGTVSVGDKLAVASGTWTVATAGESAQAVALEGGQSGDEVNVHFDPGGVGDTADVVLVPDVADEDTNVITVSYQSSLRAAHDVEVRLYVDGDVPAVATEFEIDVGTNGTRKYPSGAGEYVAIVATTSATGALDVDVTDVGGASGSSGHLVAQPVGHPGPVIAATFTFD